MPLHLITFFQEEDVLTTEMNKSATNPFTFKTCDLDSYSYRMADNKFPSSLFSCSGICLRHVALIIDQLAYDVATWVTSKTIFFTEFVKIHSSETELSALDKYTHLSFLRSMNLDACAHLYPRFSYQNYFMNGEVK